MDDGAWTRGRGFVRFVWVAKGQTMVQGCNSSMSGMRFPWIFLEDPPKISGDVELCSCCLGSGVTAPSCCWTFGCGSKLNRRGCAGVGPCFHLPRVPFWYRFFEPQPFV